MNTIFDFEDHEHFSSDLFTVESRGWIVVEKGQSVILVYYFFPFCFKFSKLLAAYLRIFYGHGSIHMLEVIYIFFKIFHCSKHLIHASFSFLSLFMLSFDLLLDG